MTLMGHTSVEMNKGWHTFRTVLLRAHTFNWSSAAFPAHP